MSPTRTPTPIATALLQQLAAIATRWWPSPKVRRLHIPQRPGEAGEHDAEFCAIELEDGAFGLSYVLLGGTLDRLLARHGSDRHDALAGADPMALAQRLAGGDEVERAVALAAVNALTDSVWRRVGYTPPPAGNSPHSSAPTRTRSSSPAADRRPATSPSRAPASAGRAGCSPTPTTRPGRRWT